MSIDLEKLRKKIYKQHDKVCNQKYADTLPYSTHLKFVEAQGNNFLHLLDNKERVAVLYALPMHDSEEDARMTYNDNVKLLCTVYDYRMKEYSEPSDENHEYCDRFAKAVADIVHCVTDEKGKNRGERKNDKYYAELKKNELAIFVKLSDLAANTLFSKLSGHKMYGKYKSEFPNFKKKVYVERFKEFFDYIENI